ncbi:phosphoglycerate kinase [Ostreibacterium oceani]|uniref:Phosphoglycerate kinase n=1 Tax=Ostreibacterium oceani TaxID=2654998 RepID=A0A6N7ERE6_9GAMM|nr:phosphoglycerate kinase [Ostreibacterium oceani]MPV85444.1 phosphoglycerate kinase [Ostreibacterium oceani]
MPFLKMTDLDLSGKKVFIREDFNVPIKNGEIQNDARLQAALETIQLALAKGAAVILGSHLGRPAEGKFDPELTLAPVASWLTKHLRQNVELLHDYLHGVSVAPGQVVLLENLRFNVGEKKCYDALSKQLGELADVFVMDAFGTAHRAQASTYGVAKFAPIACGGPLLVREIENIERSLSNAQHPIVAIVGGSKVSSKLALLDALIEKVDTLIVGGGIANTFLAATGARVGKSLHEPDLISVCHEILEKAHRLNTLIPMPIDVGTAEHFDEHAECVFKDIIDTTRDDMILDVGPKTAKNYAKLIQQSKTVIWNGPIGVFEFAHFTQGTEKLAQTIAGADAFSIAGGGDTIAAIDQFNVHDGISYITTGGGAFLEYMEGKKLPAIAILESRFADSNKI